MDRTCGRLRGLTCLYFLVASVPSIGCGAGLSFSSAPGLAAIGLGPEALMPFSAAPRSPARSLGPGILGGAMFVRGGGMFAR